MKLKPECIKYPWERHHERREKKREKDRKPGQEAGNHPKPAVMTYCG